MAILMYHHIGSCPPEQADHRGLWVSEELFDEQLRWLLAHGYESVSLARVRRHLLKQATLPKRWVVITFDDGWRDNYTRAMPCLIRHGFTATIFVVAGRIRTSPAFDRWDEYLSEEELRAMHAAGFEIGSHTWSHPRLTKLADDNVRDELMRSREHVARLLGAPPAWLAYPYGAFSARVERLVREAGYEGAVSTIRDNRVRADQLYHLPRVMVMHDTPPERFGYLFSYRYHLVHAWKNRRRWRERS